MDQQLKLYWNLGSQPARAVKCIIDIGNIKCNYVTLDVVKNQTRTKQFLEMNPLGQIPFLVHGDFKLGQSPAILIYLCEQFPQALKSYLGETKEERMKVNMFLSWYQSGFRPALFKKILIKVYGKVRKNIPFHQYQITSADKEMKEALKRLDYFLKERKFIASEKPSIVDFLFYFETTNLVSYQQESEFENYKWVKDWYNRVSQIKEVKAIMEEWMPRAQNFKKFMKSIKPIESKL